MEYFLKQFDKPLLKFSATTDTSEAAPPHYSQEPRLCPQFTGKMWLEPEPPAVYYQYL